MNNKPVIVVEGQSDVNRLINLIDADFVVCNGSAISKETIDYLNDLVKIRKIIVLTDPDFPGIQIRNKIAQNVPGVYHAYVDRSKSSNGKKLGVAECEKEEILKALAEHVVYKTNEIPMLTMVDFVELGLSGDKNSKVKRKIIYEHFHTGYSNAKTMLKHLNMLGITKKQLEEVLNDSK